MKKRLLILGILSIFITGCTEIKVPENNYQELVNNVLMYNNNYVNKAADGYKYYLPKGIKVLNNKDYNQTFKYSNEYIYLYVDIVSYYYKNKLNLKDKNINHFYYTDIYDKGYLLIDKKTDNSYYYKIIYNYAKIEGYSTYDDLSKIITYSTIIINSIDYNDITIESILNKNSASSSELNYEIAGPNNESNFSQYLEEYVDDEEQEILPDK